MCVRERAKAHAKRISNCPISHCSRTSTIGSSSTCPCTTLSRGDDRAARPCRRRRLGTPSLAGRWLDVVERLGNRCPDPILLFVIALAVTWALSMLLVGVDFGAVDPRTGQPLRINNQLTLQALATFLAGMTLTYVTFPPMGMVLVMVLGVGLAERSGPAGGGAARRARHRSGPPADAAGRAGLDPRARALGLLARHRAAARRRAVLRAPGVTRCSASSPPSRRCRACCSPR